MNVLVSIDDTDDLDSRGTGEVAGILATGIETHGWGTCAPVTRHQLLLDPRIPYTSHNSSMCFTATVAADALDQVIGYCCTQLETLSVPGSDPGLGVAVVERLSAPEELVAFGRKAKRHVLAKDEAYALAARLGVHLSEHGGTGQGVIGALAGLGLRLSGNDGRFTGKRRVVSSQGRARVRDLRTVGIELVKTLEGTVLSEDDLILVGEWVKPVLLGGKSVLLVLPDETGEGAWKACDRKVFQRY